MIVEAVVPATQLREHAEIVAVAKLDGRTIGDGRAGPLTRDIAARFRDLTRGAG